MIELIATPESWDAVGIFNWFMEHASYLLVFILMVVESSFIPFPSEVIVPPAAYLATSSLAGAGAVGSGMNIYIIVLVATAGALVGSLINYWLAVWVGRPIVYRFANSRLGHACLLNEQKVDKAEKYFDDHGASSTFIGRLIPAVRQLISIPAGLAKMPLGKFITFTTLGAGLWNIILATLGYWLGRVYAPDQLQQQIERYNSYLTLAGIILLGGCVLYILWNAFKKHPKSQN
ncbi:MAG: DedA family protein [Bacteroidales bacterium]|nr:DedA family protein [Bacteroidales bacterium]MDE6802019.1 DedA family protein [Muribaculaceae bacterium]